MGTFAYAGAEKRGESAARDRASSMPTGTEWNDRARALRLAAAAAEALGAGLVAIDPEGATLLWSDSAARILGRELGIAPKDGLPAAVLEWLRANEAPSISLPGEHGELTFTRIGDGAGPDEAVVVREPRRASAESLTRLGLTPRRTEVLAALMEGETNQQIARRLDLSPRTVQNHIAHIFEVLGARTRTEAAALARLVLESG
jgi:DNA-binding CsgD family transcriptional regulator